MPPFSRIDLIVPNEDENMLLRTFIAYQLQVYCTNNWIELNNGEERVMGGGLNGIGIISVSVCRPDYQFKRFDSEGAAVRCALWINTGKTGRFIGGGKNSYSPLCAGSHGGCARIAQATDVD